MIRFLVLLKKYIYRFWKSLLLKQRVKNGYCAIAIDTDNMGLGARIVNMLEILSYCDAKGYIPAFRFDYKESGKEHVDYFGEIFYHKNLPESALNSLKFTSIPDTSYLRMDGCEKLSLLKAKNLFDKYLNFNPSVMDEVDAFFGKCFAGKQVLGVHYRGTDKVTEASGVTLEDLYGHIKKILEENTVDLIFVSTDEKKALEYLIHLNLPVPVVYREDTMRSEDGAPVHLRKNSLTAVINREAIVNCLLLSRCDYLLKTASLLSDCSVVFNPSLKVRVMNTPYAHAAWWLTGEINEYALKI